MKSVLLVSMLLLPGCQDVASALGGNCSEGNAAYAAERAGQGKLLDATPDPAPYPMALVMSESAASKLLALVTGNLPPVSQSIVGLDVTLSPRLPTLRIETVPGCGGCVLAGLDFDVSVGVAGLGTFTGGGSATLGVPLTLHGAGPRSTVLSAGLDSAVVQSVDVRLQGLSLSDVPALQGLVSDLATQVLRAQGPKDLTTLSSWSIGKDALVAARGPVVVPETHTLLIGLQSNLVLPPAATLEEQATLPPGTDLALQVHPGLLLALLQRLMTEGSIPESYDATGAASAQGTSQAVLEGLASAPDGSLRSTFRLYQLDGALCGTADLAADISAVIDAGGVKVTARSVEVVGGTGAGQLLSQASWLAGDLLQSIAGNLQLSLNYHDITAGSMVANVAATSLVIDGKGITVNLDLVQ